MVNTKRPRGILYVNSERLAIEEIEGSPRQIAKEKSSEWHRVVFKAPEERKKEWANNLRKVVPKK